MLAIAVLLVVSTGWAVLLRWTRCPGWSVAGGVAAGLLLGPTILGRVAPDLYGSVFDGGLEEHRQLRQIVSRHGAERVAAHAADATSETMDALQQQQTAAADAANAAWRDARWAHQQSQRIFTAVMVALTLAGAAAFAIPRRGPAPSKIATASVGAWSVALPGGIAWLALRGLWDVGVTESMLVVAAVAIGPWALTAADRDAADHAEAGGARLVQAAARIATVFAVGLAVAALLMDHGSTGLWWCAALAAAAAGWVVAWPTGVRAALQFAVVPAVAATVSVRIDVITDLTLWPVVVLVLLSSDGRWLGAFIGAHVLGGRRGLRTMRLVMGSTAAGPTQIAVTAVALSTWSIDTSLAFALLLGAVLIEVTGPGRRVVAERLAEDERS